MSLVAKILKRDVTTFQHEGRTKFRAHVWTEHGYSSKVFFTRLGAEQWLPG